MDDDERYEDWDEREPHKDPYLCEEDEDWDMTTDEFFNMVLDHRDRFGC